MNKRTFPLIVLAGSLAAFVTPALADDATDKFQRMDANGDGRLTDTEHSQFVERKFQQCDTNGDGQLSTAEIQAEARGEKEMSQRAVSSHIGLVDTSGDQRISRAENSTHAQNVFTRADNNKDGILDAGEFAAAHKEMKRKTKQ